MNLTEKFVHDRKDHTDKHERWNLTENVLYCIVLYLLLVYIKIKIISLERPTFVTSDIPSFSAVSPLEVFYKMMTSQKESRIVWNKLHWV